MTEPMTDTRPARPRRRGRKRGVVLLLLAALVVGGSIAVERTTTSAVLDPPGAQDVAGADAGTAFCPIVPTDGEAARLELASASADADAQVTITRYVDGQAVVDEPRLLEAGRSAVLDLPGDQPAGPITVDWRGAPVVAQLRLAGDAGAAVGEQAVANCQTRPSDRWHIAGFDTTRGSTSRLHLFNPFGQDAVVSLAFGTTEGPVELVIADEIEVPAGQVVVRDLAEFRPETADLAVTVLARAGRVVAQGEVVRGPAGEGLEGITGRALLPAVAQPSSEVYVPEALVDDVTQSWLTVYNPSTRPAAAQLQVTTPLGDAQRLAGELTVPAGGTARVDLGGLSALPRLGVRLESVNGIGLVVTRTTAIQDADRQAIATAVGVPAPDRTWTVTGARGPDGEVLLFNPGAEVATASVEVAGGTPETWTAVSVPPNGLTALSMEGLDPQGPAQVSADQPLVAGVVNLSPETATAFWSATGTAAGEVGGGGAAVPAQRDPALSSVPVQPADATPSEEAPLALPPAEGGLDPAEPDPADPGEEPEATPTASATTAPAEPATPTTAPTPAPVPTGPTPTGEASPGPSPLPPATTESEGSLFGKVRRGGRWARRHPAGAPPG